MSTEPSSSTVRCHGRRHLLAVRDVAPNRQRAPPERADLLDGLLRVDHPAGARSGRERSPAVRLLGELRLDEDVRDRNVRPRASERQRVGPAEPARAPRDEGDAPDEIDLESHDDNPNRARGRKISLAMTSRWICDVPS